jgi:hypothetical protein
VAAGLWASFVSIPACHRETDLSVRTEAAFAGRLGSSDGLAIADISPSGCGGLGSDEPLEDAQAAEITNDERVRTRIPSFFFMTTPL